MLGPREFLLVIPAVNIGTTFDQQLYDVEVPTM